MGVVKRWVLRGLWRRLVGAGIIGPGLLGAPAPVLPVGSPETSGYNRFGPPAAPVLEEGIELLKPGNEPGHQSIHTP